MPVMPGALGRPPVFYHPGAGAVNRAGRRDKRKKMCYNKIRGCFRPDARPPAGARRHLPDAGMNEAQIPENEFFLTVAHRDRVTGIFEL